MIRLIPIDDDANHLLSQVISEKQHPNNNELDRIKYRVFEQYQLYYIYKNELEKLESLVVYDSEKAALHHCYESPTKTFKSIREKIFNIIPLTFGNRCPYCGLGQASTLDHYLPKAEYPEYSILPINLIPTCSECNTVYKLQYWLKDNKRIYINPYFDEIPNVRYLFARINHIDLSRLGFPCIVKGDSSKDVLDFFINNGGNIDTNLYNIVDSHYTALSLIKRYTKSAYEQIILFYNQVIALLPSFASRELPHVREALKRTIELECLQYGYNHFSVVIKLALVEEDAFLQFIINYVNARIA